MILSQALDTSPPVRGCTGKRSFASHLLAAKHAKWMRRKYDAPLAAYHCKSCRAWHIGGRED